MVTIRLTRRGAKNTPFYHVVVTDSRKRQGGSSLELVGFFNPTARKSDPKLRLDLPRIEHWLGEGAQQSERVRALVKTYRASQAAALAGASVVDRKAEKKAARQATKQAAKKAAKQADTPAEMPPDGPAAEQAASA